jgi:hypothetical protein
VAQGLETVSPSYANWAEADLFTRMADVIVRQPQATLPAEVAMAARVEVAERLSRLGDGVPGVACRSAFSSYEHDLELLGLSDAQVAAAYPRSRLRLYLLWSVAKVMAALPFALIGFVVHLVPFQTVKYLARRPTNEGIKATVKLLGCAASFAVVYSVLGVVVGQEYGAWSGFAVATGAPVCGYLSVWLAERVKRIGGLVSGYRTVARERDLLHAVASDRSSFVSVATFVLGNA